MESVNKMNNIVKDSIENLNSSILDKIVTNIKSFGNIESEKIEMNKEEYKENNSNFISQHIYILSPN